jgi:hypothetical protein
MKHFISTDMYYDTNTYNDIIQALKNNKVPYKEFISTKVPYNWYINTDELPKFINYDLANSNQERFLVSKVQPLRANEEYVLKRRETDGSSQEALNKFIYNDVFKNVINKYALCFRYKSKQELFEITRNIPAKIYLIGTYKNGWKLAITYNKYIKAEISPDYVVLEKDAKEMNALGEFELMINYLGLKKKDKIIKYTETPYIKGGKYYPTRINIK